MEMYFFQEEWEEIYNLQLMEKHGHPELRQQILVLPVLHIRIRFMSLEQPHLPQNILQLMQLHGIQHLQIMQRLP